MKRTVPASVFDWNIIDHTLWAASWKIIGYYIVLKHIGVFGCLEGDFTTKYNNRHPYLSIWSRPRELSQERTNSFVQDFARQFYIELV